MDSFRVGTLAKAGLRSLAMMASERALPASTSARDSGSEQVTRSSPLAARSCIAGPAPLDGTQARWFDLRPMACNQPTRARCQMPPCPVPDALNLPAGDALIASARALTFWYGAAALTVIPGGSSFISARGV